MRLPFPILNVNKILLSVSLTLFLPFLHAYMPFRSPLSSITHSENVVNLLNFSNCDEYRKKGKEIYEKQDEACGIIS